jgi:hypothetical protein
MNETGWLTSVSESQMNATGGRISASDVPMSANGSPTSARSDGMARGATGHAPRYSEAMRRSGA